jgi:hypothetical protein
MTGSLVSSLQTQGVTRWRKGEEGDSFSLAVIESQIQLFAMAILLSIFSIQS